jgi:hypothetical protein
MKLRPSVSNCISSSETASTIVKLQKSIGNVVCAMNTKQNINGMQTNMKRIEGLNCWNENK